MGQHMEEYRFQSRLDISIQVGIDALRSRLLNLGRFPRNCRPDLLSIVRHDFYVN
jgi:hypothetical protein